MNSPTREISFSHMPSQKLILNSHWQQTQTHGRLCQDSAFRRVMNMTEVSLLELAMNRLDFPI